MTSPYSLQSSPFPVPQIDLSPTLGLAFVGLILASILYGFTFLQTVFYYRMYLNDRLFLKFLVGALWSMNTASLVFKVYGLYTWLVLDYAQVLLLLDVPWSILNEPVFVSVIALVVNSFLIYRIWILRRAWWPLSALLFVWELVPFSITMYTVWRLNNDKASIVSSSGDLGWTMIAALSLESSLNLVIATTLCYLLRQGITGFSSTAQIIHSLTVYVITSGLSVAVVEWASMISYFASKATLLYLMFEMCMSSVYVITLMATLNARQSIREAPLQAIYELTAPSNGLPLSRTTGSSTLQAQNNYGVRSQKSTLEQRLSDGLLDLEKR